MTRAYRALLRLYPASFRREYGAEMWAIVRERRRDVAPGLPVAAFWARSLGDLATSALLAHLDILRQDLRFTARTLRRAPGFALTAVVVAALGVGATTATFSVADHVLLRPLPFAEPSRLVMLWQGDAAQGYQNELSPANYRDWRREATSFEGMAAYRQRSVNLVGEGDPQRLNSAGVTWDLFPLLGVQPRLGRGFNRLDDQEGAAGTVVLSHPLWLSRFGGDPDAVGRKVLLDDQPHVVIGVMPPGFHFPNRQTDLWTAMRFAEADFEDRGDTYLYAVARRRRDVPLEQARAEMGVIAGRLERAYPEANAGVGALVVPLRDHVNTQSRLLLGALLGAALCVLLIACTNLAGLLLARGLFRTRELAVRTALGAGRERLVRQLLTESLLLAAAGGALGVLLAVAAMPLVTRLVPNVLPIAAVPAVDLRVLAFAVATTALTGIGFGMVPALRAARAVDADALRDRSAAAGTGPRERLRSWLVTAEVTASVVLLVAAGLLIRALGRVQQVDPGFRGDGVLTLRTALPLPRYAKTLDRQQFYRRVLEGARALPGVEAAAYTSFLPMVMRGGIWTVEVEGQPRPPGQRPPVSLRFVTPGYFETLRIPILAGRDVSEGDTQGGPAVAVVSRSFAARHWPGDDPLGRRFTVAFVLRTVVGVAGDVRVRGLERSSEPQVYLPYQQVEDGGLVGYIPKDLAIRASADAESLIPAVRRIVQQADPQQPVSDVRLLAEVVADDTAPRSVQVRVLALFAAVAVLLAAIGIHGLLAFTVSHRAQEIGVRVALGAQPRDVLALVLRQGAQVAAAGVAAGLFLAYAAGRSLQALLAGLSPRDATSFAVAVALAVLMTLSGSAWSALRAVRLDPVRALRGD
ncbi:MAG TPA: ABC transporter permease [Vicinamibacteria bacterium]